MKGWGRHRRPMKRSGVKILDEHKVRILDPVTGEVSFAACPPKGAIQWTGTYWDFLVMCQIADVLEGIHRNRDKVKETLIELRGMPFYGGWKIRDIVHKIKQQSILDGFSKGIQ